MGLQGVKRGKTGLQKATRDDNELQGVKRGYRGLQGMTRGYKVL